MTTTELWDAKFLRERERDAREEAVWRLTEADWKRALAEVDRIRSNNGCRYRLCRNAACRRARNCIRDTPNCMKKPASNEAAPSPLAEAIYARLQTERRDAAKAGKKKRAPDSSKPLTHRRARA